MLLVQDFLENSAKTNPDHVALVCDLERPTYRQLDLAANRLANTLIDWGVCPGDRVVLYLPNSVELVVAIFAVLKASAVFVVLNPTMKAEKVERLVADCAASGLVMNRRNNAVAQRLLAQLRSLKFALLTGDMPPLSSAAPGLYSWRELSTTACADRPPRRTIDLDLACLVYTSGSSGEAKGVMAAHSNMVFVSQSVTSYLQNRPDDIILCALPLSFGYGLYQLLMSAMIGATLVLETSFAFPAKTLRIMQQERVTGLAGVPTMFSMLLGLDTSGFDLSSLRYLTSAAAALPEPLIKGLVQRFPDVAIYSMYGLTETKRALYLPPEEIHRRPESVGIAIPGTEVWLVDENDCRVGPNQVGQLVIRGRHVMRGYWGDVPRTQLRFRPGPLPGEQVCYSGDLFRRDEDGFYYYVGRMDNVFKCRGEKVAPEEVEAAICRLPGVAEAAVVGVPDPMLGHRVKAFVVRSSSLLSEADVLRHCRSCLEDHMVPSAIEFRAELPKNANGKIQKSLLCSPTLHAT